MSSHYRLGDCVQTCTNVTARLQSSDSRDARAWPPSFFRRTTMDDSLARKPPAPSGDEGMVLVTPVLDHAIARPLPKGWDKKEGSQSQQSRESWASRRCLQEQSQ
jgi:hypothetical protein